jgi:hypothetical protein
MLRSSCLCPALLGAAALLSWLSPSAAARAESWGTITGQVVLEGSGPVPERAKINVTKDQDACLAKGPLLAEELIANPKNRGVKDVLVWLIDAKNPKAPLPIHPRLAAAPLPDVEIDQPCCQFVPHIIAMREGQALVVKNSAAIAHNVHVIGGIKGPDFNVILPPGGQKKVSAEEIPARPTAISVKCDIHPWMYGYIRVFAHPYFAKTDADGKFTIKDAPAGDWRIVIWQENGWVKGDKNGTPITVEAGKTTDLGQVNFPLPKKE